MRKKMESFRALTMWLPLVLAVTLSACGFQLRGSHLEELKDSRVYVKSSGAKKLADEVKRQLEFAEVAVVQDPGQAQYVIEVMNERFDRKVLSVSADTGKVEEYELTYNSLLTVTGPEGNVLLKNEPVTAQRDYTFDEDSVLGKFDEEKKLREEITRHAADSVLRRFRTVTR